jgi:hypothetical protein
VRPPSSAQAARTRARLRRGAEVFCAPGGGAARSQKGRSGVRGAGRACLRPRAPLPTLARAARACRTRPDRAQRALARWADRAGPGGRPSRGRQRWFADGAHRPAGGSSSACAANSAKVSTTARAARVARAASNRWPGPTRIGCRLHRGPAGCLAHLGPSESSPGRALLACRLSFSEVQS